MFQVNIKIFSDFLKSMVKSFVLREHEFVLGKYRKILNF